jgi:transposase
MAQKNELKPWLVKSWCIGQPSARYVAKMEDVLEVYQRPYDARRPVVCLDEKSKELHETPHGELPMQPRRERRQDYEYVRNGTCNLFLMLEPLHGWRRVHVTQRRTALDFAEQLRILVEEVYSDAETIVLVTDNLNTHSTACLYERFPPEQALRIARKLEWHYTPEHGSWLNMAECELSVLSRQCLNRRIPDVDTLAAAVQAWQTQRNAAKVTVDWHFTADDARIRLKRLYPSFEVQNVT